MSSVKKTIILLSIILFLQSAGLTFPETDNPARLTYYRVDKVKTLRGDIADIKKEKCFYKKDFIVIYLKEKKSGEIYRLEVSPGWFFAVDLMKGSRIEVTGSYSKENNMNLIMTRAITFQGEVYQFRDKNGFPLWRGKGKGMRQPRKGKGRGKMKGRGRY